MAENEAWNTPVHIETTSVSKNRCCLDLAWVRIAVLSPLILEFNWLSERQYDPVPFGPCVRPVCCGVASTNSLFLGLTENICVYFKTFRLCIDLAWMPLAVATTFPVSAEMPDRFCYFTNLYVEKTYLDLTWVLIAALRHGLLRKYKISTFYVGMMPWSNSNDRRFGRVLHEVQPFSTKFCYAVMCNVVCTACPSIWSRASWISTVLYEILFCRHVRRSKWFLKILGENPIAITTSHFKYIRSPLAYLVASQSDNSFSKQQGRSQPLTSPFAIGFLSAFENTAIIFSMVCSTINFTKNCFTNTYDALDPFGFKYALRTNLHGSTARHRCLDVFFSYFSIVSFFTFSVWSLFT